MDRKFWEREDFDIAMFYAVFQGVYDLFYDNGLDEPIGLVRRYDAMCEDGSYDVLIGRLSDFRHDIVTSDREAAAFVVACDIYERRYGNVNA